MKNRIEELLRKREEFGWDEDDLNKIVDIFEEMIEDRLVR